MLGLFAILGAALMYGDGVITPAISVLSAVEGLKEIDPHFEQYIVPVAVVILLGVFFVQRHGTHRIGPALARSWWCGFSCWPGLGW